jgi:hypothetical protein
MVFLLCVVRCSLFVARYALCVVRCALCVMRYALCVMRCALCVVRYALCVMRCALCVMRCALCVMRYALCVVRYALCVVRCALCVVRVAVVGGERLWSGPMNRRPYVMAIVAVRVWDSGSWLTAYGSRLMAHGSWLVAHGSRLTAHGLRLTAHGSRLREGVHPSSGRLSRSPCIRPVPRRTRLTDSDDHRIARSIVSTDLLLPSIPQCPPGLPP